MALCKKSIFIYFFFYKYSELLFYEYLSFLGVEPQDILPPNIFFYNLQNK